MSIQFEYFYGSQAEQFSFYRMLTINALTAANEVIIPVQSHFLPAKGLEQLLGTVAKVKRQLNPTLKINGILLTIVINESGLYSLILSSKLPNAKKFKHWVTSKVLPSIRKHGMYATDELLSNPDFAISVFQQLKAERDEKQRLLTVNNQQQQIIGELQPKANYVDIVLDNKGLVTITQIAKDYGMSGNQMNKLLNTYGIQYKQSGQWLLYSKYHNMGYTHSKTINITRTDGRPDIVMETKWTQKGRLFIYETLKRTE